MGIRTDPDTLRRCLELAGLAEPPAPPLVETISEEAFQAEIMKLAKRHGWMAYHPLISKGSKEGWPDLVLLRAGILIIAELKTATGKTSAAQRSWLEELRKVPSIRVYTWRPSDWLLIRQTLETPATESPPGG